MNIWLAVVVVLFLIIAANKGRKTADPESDVINDATDSASNAENDAVNNGASQEDAVVDAAVIAAKTCAAGEHLYKKQCVKNSNLVHLGEWATNRVKTSLTIDTPTVDDAKSYAALKDYDTFVYMKGKSGYGGKLGFNPSKKSGGWQVYGKPFTWRGDGEWKSYRVATKLNIKTPTLEDAKAYASKHNHDRFVFMNGKSGYGGKVMGNPSKKSGGWQVYSRVYT